MARSIEAHKHKGLQAVRFRNKVTGWKDSHFTTVYDDGTVDSAPLFATEYGRAFGRALFLRPSCYRCPYTSMTRPGDLHWETSGACVPTSCRSSRKRASASLW